jgi:magnesium chelatase subunit D
MSDLAAQSAEAKRTEGSSGAEGVAFQVAALLAVDPVGLAGVVLRGPADPRRDEWLEAFRKLLPADAPWRRVPLGIADSRLLGGLDLAASLSAGRPIAQAGLLAEANGGIIILPMAERVESQMIARIAAVLDSGALRVAREGITMARATRFGIVAMDEGASEEEQVTEALSDRLAFRLSCDTTSLQRAAAPKSSSDAG